MTLGLAACTGQNDDTPVREAKAQFMAGFGMVDITPEGSVPLGSYGDSRERMSTGVFSYLDA